MILLLIVGLAIAAAICAIVGISESATKWNGISALLISIAVLLIVGERFVR